MGNEREVLSLAYQAKWAENPEKLNRNELIKLEKDGLDVIQDIYRYAKLGFDSIPADDLERFKWAGVYQQKPHDGHFMMRVRIPSGILTSEQARTLAGISRDYGRQLLDITTRQAIQFHWLTVENLPPIFERLAAVGLSSFEACGDCPRTIVGNPLAGVDPDELMDTRPLVKQLQDFFLGNKDFSNLPRKYKMSISANIYNAGHAEINDLAFVPASKTIDGKEVIGFHILVGGGLSAKPMLAQPIDVFVRPEEVLKVAVAVTTLFRDHGYREKRNHARLKFLVADWGSEKFREELVRLTGELPRRGVDRTVGWNGGYFLGVHEQKQKGFYYAGLSIPVGRMQAEDLAELARLADTYGEGTIRTCNSQNVVIPGIPKERLEAFLEEPLLQRFTPYPQLFVGHAISCTGNEFCNLALVETKERVKQIAQYLDEHVSLDVPIRLNVNGCTNSCGQQQIADIGLQGARLKTEAGLVDAFDISVGGTLGPGATFNTKLQRRIPAEKIAPVLAQLLNYFKATRLPEETFHAYVKRVGIPTLQKELDQILDSLV